MRTSGILMHITSLPSPYGIGTLGAEARKFSDFLSDAKQSWWQILPICPTSFGDSPYQSFSAFAGNPYLIDLDDLAADGLLEPSEFAQYSWGDDPESVDFALLYRQRYPVLRKASERLLQKSTEEMQSFFSENAFWLDDYALFMALKDAHGGAPWKSWEAPLRNREPEALERASREFNADIEFWKAVQFLFFRQWRALRSYANSRNVCIIGDLPLYVSADSVDVWACPKQFQLDDDLNPIEVAGCPPDGFSADGQLWGNPLFDWDYMDSQGYDWWVRRIDYQCKIYDMLRIDHFRGFDSYYAVPSNAPNAKDGHWRIGPGMKLFKAVEEAIGRQSIIAEDLGFLTDSVHELRDSTGFPGMKVLQFAFDSRDDNNSTYLPHNYLPHCVAYIGTHDNDTARGWLRSASPEDVSYAKSYLRLNQAEGEVWGMQRALWASPADMTIAQMQDLLDLDSPARMNIPSTVGGNWKWRALPGFDSPALAQSLRHEMQIYCRLPSTK